MSKKIRIKFPDGRIEGPLLESEIEGHLSDLESYKGIECQIIPSNDWIDWEVYYKKLNSQKEEKKYKSSIDKEFKYTIGTNESPVINKDIKEDLDSTKVIDSRSFIDNEINSPKKLIFHLLKKKLRMKLLKM